MRDHPVLCHLRTAGTTTCAHLEENMEVAYQDRPLQRSPNVTLRMFSAWNTAKAQESTIRAQNHAWMSSQLKSEAGIVPRQKLGLG